MTEKHATMLALDSNIIINCTHLGAIEVSGRDAQKFLQGQFTNDVTKINPNQAQLSAWCSVKGRILVSFYLVQRDENYYLILPLDSVNSTLKRLQMFVLRSEVKLRSFELQCFAIAGEQISELGLNLPSQKFAVTLANNISVLKLPGAARYLLIHTDAAIMQQLWTQLTAKFIIADANHWQLLDIMAGIPSIGAELSDNFIPQMLNWQAIGGLSFKKGCYTGQEVVARMQYLGQLKRRMYLAILYTDNPPIMSDKLFWQQENAGEIVHIQPHPDGGYALLAVLKIALADKSIYTANGDKLQLQTLPYQIEDSTLASNI
jgi:tRNA-modifying protein YgfZ